MVRKTSIKKAQTEVIRATTVPPPPRQRSNKLFFPGTGGRGGRPNSESGKPATTLEIRKNPSQFTTKSASDQLASSANGKQSNGIINTETKRRSGWKRKTGSTSQRAQTIPAIWTPLSKSKWGKYLSQWKKKKEFLFEGRHFILKVICPRGWGWG